MSAHKPMSRLLWLAGAAAAVLWHAQIATAQQPAFSKDECRKIHDLTVTVVKNLGRTTFSGELLTGLDAWFSNGSELTCDGPREIHVRQYRDIAFINLIELYLLVYKPPIHLSKAGLIVVEPDATPTKARVLPTGYGGINSLLKSSPNLSQEQFKSSSLYWWGLLFTDYERLRKEGFSNEQILFAVEDANFLGRGLDYRGLRDFAILARDENHRRSERNCEFRRLAVALAADTKLQDLGRLYRSATGDGNRQRLSAQVQQRTKEVQKLVSCFP